MKLKKGDLLTLTITDLAFGGESVARTEDNLVVFVKGGLPGEEVRVQITRCKGRFVEGKVLEVLCPSPFRVQARCKHFGPCGGCTWQDLYYPEQLKFKQKQVQDALVRIGKLTDFSINPMVGMSPEPWYYRNKMEYTFGYDPQDQLILGQHRSGHWDQLVDIETCWLQSPTSNKILNLCKEFARKHGLTAYSNKTHQGLLRHLVIREGKNTGEVMVNLVTSGEDFPQVHELVQVLTAQVPEITSIVLNVNRRVGETSQGQEEKVLWGRPTIREIINGLQFEISANSFFQTNTWQAERLYRFVLNMAEVHKGSIVWDLYCGTGAIALHLAPLVKEVHGVELNPIAVENAQLNAQKNRIENVFFHCGEVKKVLRTLPFYPDLIVVDPPRDGLNRKVIQAMVDKGPSQIIYVSCNPTTLARDLKDICEAGYKISQVQPIDMFPHTYHIETVVSLVRCPSSVASDSLQPTPDTPQRTMDN